VLRRARANYRAQLVELGAATPELVLLGALAFAERRAATSVEHLRRAEAAAARRHALSGVVAPAMTALALGALVVRPASAALWIVVAALLAFTTLESLTVVRDALDTAVSVSAAAERLEELDESPRRGHVAWPRDSNITFDHVTITEADEVLLADASLSVAPGHKVALTGPSGVGKSTVLRAIAALDDVAAGAITVGRVSVSDLDEGDLRHFVAYVASEPGLTRGFAVDVVNLGRQPARNALDDLAAMGLVVDASHRWEEPSRGERARIALARALVTSPTVVVLDEPTSGLGVDETRAVLSLLESTGATVIVATHDPQVMDWCDQVLELSDGALRELRR
jgi:ABC-type transport system involved in cytochrome bd biosynthesis fused ATPase/permease subunit